MVRRVEVGKSGAPLVYGLDSVRSSLRVNSFINLFSGFFFTACNWNDVCISLFLVLLVCIFFSLKEPSNDPRYAYSHTI